MARTRGGSEQTPNLTLLLRQMQEGDVEAAEKAISLVYAELHRLAARELQHENPGHLLQTTALIHEAYVRLIDARNLRVQSRVHFFAIASRQMRRILVDHARLRNAQKRGSGAITVELSGVQIGFNPKGVELLALDEALTELQEIDSRAANVVELRFFGGYTDEEIARGLGISPATVRRDWEFARSWLFDRIHGIGGEEAASPR